MGAAFVDVERRAAVDGPSGYAGPYFPRTDDFSGGMEAELHPALGVFVDKLDEFRRADPLAVILARHREGLNLQLPDILLGLCWRDIETGNETQGQ